VDYGEECDVHFLQISTVPLSSMVLTTGSPILNGDGRKKQVHMRMLGPPPDLPKVPNGVKAIVQDGYKKHIAHTVSSYNAPGGCASRVIPFPNWGSLFHSVTSVIDKMIYAHHGIKCHVDRNINNEMLINIFYLHVCDVLNIIACRHNNTPLPQVAIRTSMLQSLPDSILETLTTALSELTKESFGILLSKINFFYIVYVYYGNGSFLSL
jgi:hypothetical protein